MSNNLPNPEKMKAALEFIADNNHWDHGDTIKENRAIARHVFGRTSDQDDIWIIECCLPEILESDDE
jgi:hypothetical protein